MKERKIVACCYCKVKKYNFDMIEKFPNGKMGNSNLYCSLNCLNLSTKAATTQPLQPRSSPMPVISAVSSLAVQQQQQQIPVQTQTVREVVKETTVLPADVASLKNKATMTRPMMVSKGVSCKPHPCHKETQTEGLQQPVPVPVPVPIHLPTPVKMYNAPFPVPIPIPLPFPVPVFIPTTRRSVKGIEKCIKKILNKIPADPFGKFWHKFKFKYSTHYLQRPSFLLSPETSLGATTLTIVPRTTATTRRTTSMTA